MINLTGVGVKRLVLIKNLFELGVKESKKSSPQNSYSIVIFHDSIELFFGLVLSYATDVTLNKKTYFLDYINLIKQHLNFDLKYKGQMKGLNNARISIKHEGLTLSDDEIEKFRSFSRGFLEKNIDLIFGLKYEEISLVDLIKNESIKNNLNEVKDLIKQDEYTKAADKLHSTFRYIFDDHRDRMPFRRIVSYTPYNSDIPSLINDYLREIYRDLELIFLEIDIKKYFKYITFLNEISDSKVQPLLGEQIKIINIKRKIQFCTEFVINCALIVQNFQLEIEMR